MSGLAIRASSPGKRRLLTTLTLLCLSAGCDSHGEQPIWPVPRGRVVSPPLALPTPATAPSGGAAKASVIGRRFAAVVADIEQNETVEAWESSWRESSHVGACPGKEAARILRRAFSGEFVSPTAVRVEGRVLELTELTPEGDPYGRVTYVAADGRSRLLRYGSVVERGKPPGVWVGSSGLSVDGEVVAVAGQRYRGCLGLLPHWDAVEQAKRLLLQSDRIVVCALNARGKGLRPPAVELVDAATVRAISRSLAHAIESPTLGCSCIDWWAVYFCGPEGTLLVRMRASCGYWLLEPQKDLPEAGFLVKPHGENARCEFDAPRWVVDCFYSMLTQASEKR